MSGTRVDIPPEIDESFCHEWKIRELALFGSAVRGEMSADSDIDVLVTFEEDATWSLWDLLELRDELARVFSRDVDLVEADAIRNPFRRHEIMRTRKVLYAA